MPSYRVKWSEEQIRAGNTTREALRANGGVVFRQGEHRYKAGTIYTGDSPAVPLSRGWLEVSDGEV